MNERMMIAMAVFLYVMAILEPLLEGKGMRDRLIPAIYLVLAFGLFMAWVWAA